jgi:F-type H+-transporting ATPase subunit beta
MITRVARLRRRLGVRAAWRTHPRGNDLFIEMTDSNVIKDTALVFGQMDEPPGTAAGRAVPR